jgi:hypothetical protein
MSCSENRRNLSKFTVKSNSSLRVVTPDWTGGPWRDGWVCALRAGPTARAGHGLTIGQLRFPGQAGNDTMRLLEKLAVF